MAMEKMMNSLRREAISSKIDSNDIFWGYL